MNVSFGSQIRCIYFSHDHNFISREFMFFDGFAQYNFRQSIRVYLYAIVG